MLAGATIRAGLATGADEVLGNCSLTGPQASAAVASSAGRPERPSGRGAPAPIAVLAVIGIAVAVPAGIARSGWGLLPVALGLLIARRLIRHAGTPALRCAASHGASTG